MKHRVIVRRRAFPSVRRFFRRLPRGAGQGWLALFARGHQPVGGMSMTQAALLLRAGQRVRLRDGGELEMVNGRVLRVNKIPGQL